MTQWMTCECPNCGAVEEIEVGCDADLICHGCGETMEPEPSLVGEEPKR